MKDDKFIKINKDSVLNQDEVVRKKVNGVLEYYFVSDYDNQSKKYILKSFTGNAENVGFKIVTTTQDLIDNFEKRYENN